MACILSIWLTYFNRFLKVRPPSTDTHRSVWSLMCTGRRIRMKKYPRPLTSAFIQRQDLEPGKYYDRDGLYLRVRKTQSKYWEHRVYVNGRFHAIGVGRFPIVDLRAARSQVRRHLLLIEEGENPLSMRSKEKIPTVAELAEIVLEKHRHQWADSNAPNAWLRRFELYVSMPIGGLPVSDVEPEHVLKILQPLWATKRPTAQKVRQCLHQIMAHAVAEKYRTDNPAGRIISSLLMRGGAKRTHHRAVPYAEVATVLDAYQKSNASLASKLSLRFMVLTAARLGEVRGARWSEIDLNKRVWTVPAKRMKARNEHKVPLSFQSLEVLEQARELSGDDMLIFPSPTGGLLSNATHSVMFRKLGLACVPHGFRSSFRDWCGENGVPREIAEACLAHAVGNAVEAAYRRTDLLELRREVLDTWARHLEMTAPSHPNEGGQ